MNHVLAQPSQDVSRLVIISSWEQAKKLRIPSVVAFCIVDNSGTVSYYRKEMK